MTRFDVFQQGVEFLTGQKMTVVDMCEYIRNSFEFCEHCPVSNKCDQNYREFCNKTFDPEHATERFLII